MIKISYLKTAKSLRQGNIVTKVANCMLAAIQKCVVNGTVG